MENQSLIEILEGLQNAGFIYNDADFCRKTGIKHSFVSDMKSGKKPFTPQTRKKIEEIFPDYFHPRKVEINQGDLTLGEMYQAMIEHDIRFHELANRILDAMGVAPVMPKEKTA